MDFEFWLRIACKRKRMCHIPAKIANFRWYENSKSSNVFSQKVLIDENRQLQYKKSKLYYFLFGIKRNFLSPLKRGLVGKKITRNKKGREKGTIVFFNES
jgi:hypothetical protein